MRIQKYTQFLGTSHVFCCCHTVLLQLCVTLVSIARILWACEIEMMIMNEREEGSFAVVDDDVFVVIPCSSFHL